MADDITAVVGGDTKGLKDALREATTELRSFSDSAGGSLKSIDDQMKRALGAVGKTLSSVQDVFTATLGSGGIIGTIIYLQSQTNKAVDLFKEIGDAADAAAVSTDFWQWLRLEAQRSNVEFSKVTAGVKAFGAALGKLKNDYGGLHDALKGNNDALLTQLKAARSVEGGIRLVSDAIKKLPGDIEQSRLAAVAFGKDNAPIAKVFNEGSAAIDAAIQRSREFGVVVDENIIRHSQQIKRDVSSVSSVIDLQFKQALLRIMPIMSDVSKAALKLSGMILGIRDAIVATQYKSDVGIERAIKNYRNEIEKEIAAFKKLGEEYQDVQNSTFGGYGYGGMGARSFTSMFDPNFYDPTISTRQYNLNEIAEESRKKFTTLNEKIDEYNELMALKAQRDTESAERQRQLNENLFSDQKAREEEENSRKLIEGLRAMEELKKRYYADTHQWLEAIRADQEREAQRFKILLEDGKINYKQYQEAMVLITADANAKIKAEQDKLAHTLRESMRGISGEFDKILSSWQSGHALTVKEIERDFVNMIMRIVLKAAVLEPLFGTGRPGQNEFGIVGGAIQGVLGGGGLGGLLSGVKLHEGGVAGEDGTPIMMPASVFEGAARYHNGGIAGLLPNEVPAILQKGETVIPAGGGVPGGNTYNTYIQTPNPEAFRQSQGQISAMITRAAGRGQRNL